jgi:hypothetical protein
MTSKMIAAIHPHQQGKTGLRPLGLMIVLAFFAVTGCATHGMDNDMEDSGGMKDEQMMKDDGMKDSGGM